MQNGKIIGNIPQVLEKLKELIEFEKREIKKQVEPYMGYENKWDIQGSAFFDNVNNEILYYLFIERHILGC